HSKQDPEAGEKTAVPSTPQIPPVPRTRHGLPVSPPPLRPPAPAPAAALCLPCAVLAPADVGRASPPRVRLDPASSMFGSSPAFPPAGAGGVECQDGRRGGKEDRDEEEEEEERRAPEPLSRGRSAWLTRSRHPAVVVPAGTAGTADRIPSQSGSKASGERSSDKGSPALAPVHDEADHDDGGPDMPADVQDQRGEGAAGARPSEDAARGRTLSPAETARRLPSEPADAAADVPAAGAEKKAGKRDAEKGAKSDAAGAGRMKPEVSSDAEELADRPSRGEKVGSMAPAVKKRGAERDERWDAEDATAEEPGQVEPAPENEFFDYIRHHEAPTIAGLAKNPAAADAEENAIEAAAAAEEVPRPVDRPPDSELAELIKHHEAPSFSAVAKHLAEIDAEENAIEAAAAAEEVPRPVDRPPDSELAELIKHHEAPSFSAVAKHLAEIDAEEKAIDDAAAAKEVPEPGHHSRDSGLLEHIKSHEAPTFVEVAKHAAQKEETESEPTDGPVLKREVFPTIAEAGGAKDAAHIMPQETGDEDAENLVQKIAHDRAPSFAEIAKPHEAEHAEVDGPVRTAKEEDRETGLALLLDPKEASDRDEESGDVFLSALELEQQQGQQQQQQEPAPGAAEERTAKIADEPIGTVAKAADTAASPAENAVQGKASAAGGPAHEEKEIFVAEPCRPAAGSEAGTSRREADKKKKAARVSLFVGAGALAAAAIAILGLTARYRLRKGPAASLGTAVGAVVGLFGWM
ncbi:MAG: hypothetical protein BJ554DRAFT_6500, partial [Olpidium bornovanus]